MKKITDRKMINYLAHRGIYPKRQNDKAAYYEDSARLNRLEENFYIERVCFANWQPRYFK